MGDGHERPLLVAIEDQSRHLVLFVRDEVGLQERLERQIGEGELRREPLHGAARGDAGKRIARARGRGLGKEVLEVGKRPACAVDDRAVGQGRLLFVSRISPARRA